jgi:hypothetical protein
VDVRVGVCTLARPSSAAAIPRCQTHSLFCHDPFHTEQPGHEEKECEQRGRERTALEKERERGDSDKDRAKERDPSPLHFFHVHAHALKQ